MDALADALLSLYFSIVSDLGTKSKSVMHTAASHFNILHIVQHSPLSSEFSSCIIYNQHAFETGNSDIKSYEFIVRHYAGPKKGKGVNSVLH